MSQSTEVAGTARRRFTKIRAILAGGLVLGVGAAITLAAWNDSEVATGSFAAGTFGIEGSTNGTEFAEHPDEASAASLEFEVGADSLSPGESVYEGFAVRLINTSDYAADVIVAQDITSALVGTTASYVYIDSTTCDATTFAAGDNAGAAFSLTALNTPVFVCFQVSADDTLVQGATGSITWTFAAESTTTLTP